MKLWDKGYHINNLVEKFTVGQDRILDLKLARFDILGSMAHAEMLHKTGLLTDEELENILAVLHKLLQQVEAGTFSIGDAFEDVHSQVEYILTQELGETGKKIHTARSRNDQVLVDLHLFFKSEIEEIKQLIALLFDTLIELAQQYSHVIMPGYTHTQVAMPSSFGLWFSAYAESLIDDVILLNAAYEIADQNPLGSAAGYGSSFPVDRDFTTGKLGFKHLKVSSVAAQMSRGKLEKSLAFAVASVAGTLSKLANDVILFMSQNFGFVGFPDELTTGSSIMPHKKNPDVFELIRAKANRLQALPNDILLITNNLTTGYHRDFQLLKEIMFPALDELKEILEVTRFMLTHIRVNENIMDNPLYDSIYSVELVNRLVREGMSFRDAYRETAKRIKEGTYEPPKELNHTHKGSIGNLALDDIQSKFRHYF